jgi:hypothetical protein
MGGKILALGSSPPAMLLKNNYIRRIVADPLHYPYLHTLHKRSQLDKKAIVFFPDPQFEF